MKILWMSIVLVLLSHAMPDAWAKGTSDAKCERIERQISDINDAMRRGLRGRKWEKYKERLRKLKKDRRQQCS